MILVSPTCHPAFYYIEMKHTLCDFVAAPAPAPASAAPTINTHEDRHEDAILSAGNHLLKGVSISRTYNKDTHNITVVGFAAEAQEYLNMLAASTNDEHIHGLKMLLDSNNSIKTDATKYNNLVKARNVPDDDSLVAMAFITS